MKTIRFGCAGLILSSALVMQHSLAIQPLGAIPTPARSASSVSSQSGTVVKIDARSGELVLDGARRFTFDPGGGVSVREQNGASANMAAVKVGASVRLTVIKSPGYASSPVTELWIVK